MPESLNRESARSAESRFDDFAEQPASGQHGEFGKDDREQLLHGHLPGLVRTKRNVRRRLGVLGDIAVEDTDRSQTCRLRVARLGGR